MVLKSVALTVIKLVELRVGSTAAEMVVNLVD